jgi:hypothetical protein
MGLSSELLRVAGFRFFLSAVNLPDQVGVILKPSIISL